MDCLDKNRQTVQLFPSQNRRKCMRYLTAGESHGPRLTAIIEGVPAGLSLTADYINAELKRRPS